MCAAEASWSRGFVGAARKWGSLARFVLGATGRLISRGRKPERSRTEWNSPKYTSRSSDGQVEWKRGRDQHSRWKEYSKFISSNLVLGRIEPQKLSMSPTMPRYCLGRRPIRTLVIILDGGIVDFLLAVWFSECQVCIFHEQSSVQQCRPTSRKLSDPSWACCPGR